MEQAYEKVLAESLISVQDEKMNLMTTSSTPFQRKIRDNIPSNICSTPMPSNGRNRREISSTSVGPTNAETVSGTKPDKEPTADCDIEILEWIPGTDVKPVVKSEDNMDWV